MSQLIGYKAKLVQTVSSQKSQRFGKGHLSFTKPQAPVELAWLPIV